MSDITPLTTVLGGVTKIEDKSGLAFDYVAGTEFYIASEFKVNGLDARILKVLTPTPTGPSPCYVVILMVNGVWLPTPWLNLEILNELELRCAVTM
jgi:hypothetical protein